MKHFPGNKIRWRKIWEHRVTFMQLLTNMRHAKRYMIMQLVSELGGHSSFTDKLIAALKESID